MCSMEGFFQSVQRTGSNVSKHHPNAANAVAGKAAFFAVLCIYCLQYRTLYSLILSLAKKFFCKSVRLQLGSLLFLVTIAHLGEVSEWLKEHAWKVCIRLRVSRVRIPLSPRFIIMQSHDVLKGLNLKGLGFFYAQYTTANNGSIPTTLSVYLSV